MYRSPIVLWLPMVLALSSLSALADTNPECFGGQLEGFQPHASAVATSYPINEELPSGDEPNWIEKWAANKYTQWSTSNGRCKEIGKIQLNQIRFQTFLRTALFAIFARPRLAPHLPQHPVAHWSAMWAALYGLSYAFDWVVAGADAMGKKLVGGSMSDSINDQLRVRTIVDRMQREMESACDDEYPLQ